MALGAFGITRICFFAALLVFSLGALALGASITAQLTSLNAGYDIGWTPGYLGIAVGALTIVTIIPLIVIDLVNKLSLVTVELVACGVLWVLWLAAAAYLTSDLTISNCDGIDSYYYPTLASLCHQYQGFQAFSWLAWVLLTVYLILLLTLAIMGQVRGRIDRIWLKPASDLQYSPRPGGQQQHMMGNTSYNNMNTPYTSTPAPTTPGGGYAPSPYGTPAPYQQQPQMMQQQPPPMMMQQNTGGNYAQGYVPAPGVAQV